MTIGIERTPNGRLWACWVGGGDNEKAFFVLASSEDAGATWSKPRAVIDPHDPALPFARRVIVGALWLDPRGRLWWFFDQALTHFYGRAGTWAVRCDQPDAVEPVWSEPVRIWHGCVLNKPIIRANGEWLLTISLWDRWKTTERFFGCFPELDEWRMINFFVSKDEGLTWQRRGGVQLCDGSSLGGEFLAAILASSRAQSDREGGHSLRCGLFFTKRHRFPPDTRTGWPRVEGVHP